MASPTKINITPENTGLLKLSQSQESAKKTTDLLQEDLETHHVFFNDRNFHNHLVHHVLSLYGTGATASCIQQAWDGNSGYQRPAMPTHADLPLQLSDWAAAKKHLGNPQFYPDFLAFFQREIAASSWQDVLNTYVFRPDDERADDMMVRLFSGIVHPLIQLLYGIEWDQPAIVAEALAQACVHEDDLRPFLLGAERRACEDPDPQPMPPVLDLYRAVAADPVYAATARSGAAAGSLGEFLALTHDHIAAQAARVRIRPDEVHERAVEIFNACVFVAAGAALSQPNKEPRFDFVLMHSVNSSPILLLLAAAPWVPAAAKARLLEWKARVDLAHYAAAGAPAASGARVAAYGARAWDAAAEPSAFTPLHRLVDDDGHAVKLARALAVCQRASEPLEHALRDRLPVRGGDAWRRLHRLVVDAVDVPAPRWVRFAGHEEAWKDVPDTPKL